MLQRVSPFLCLFATASLARADFITGRLVDDNGVGIANGDVDARDLNTGCDLILTGDSTDANGFFNVAIPNGLYRLTFQGPPAGPNTYQAIEMCDVVVVGTLDLGTIVLEQTHQLSGRVVDQNGLPVFPCDLDIFHGVTGDTLLVSGARTDIFGNFSILVPKNIILRFDPRMAVGPQLAPLEFPVMITVPTVLPDTVLPPGYTVSGTVVGSGGLPVQGATLDFFDPAGDPAVLYGRSTDAFGSFSVVVAANTWDIEICPPGSSTDAPLRVLGVAIAGTTNLGTLAFAVGHTLFGTVTDSMGLPVQGVDVDVKDAATGADVFLCGDGTNAAGAYSVQVPAGTYDVFFTRPDALAIQTDVVVAATTQVDAVLTPCAAATATFRNGSGTNPVRLTSVSPPRIGRSWKVDLDCTGFSPGVGFILLNENPVGGFPTAFGELLVGGPQLLFLSLSHTGNVISFVTPIPPNTTLCGRMGYAQGLIHPNLTFTNALDLMVGH